MIHKKTTLLSINVVPNQSSQAIPATIYDNPGLVIEHFSYSSLLFVVFVTPIISLQK